MANWKEELNKLKKNKESKKKNKSIYPKDYYKIPITERVSREDIKRQDEERDRHHGLGIRYEMPVFSKGVLNRNTKYSKYRDK